MREQELILYRNFEEGELLKDMVWLMENYEDEYYNIEDKRALCYTNIHRLLEMAGSYGFSGNLWHCYLTNLLVNNENSYSKACEIRGEIEGSINEAVLHDITIIKDFFAFLSFLNIIVVFFCFLCPLMNGAMAPMPLSCMGACLPFPHAKKHFFK